MTGTARQEATTKIMHKHSDRHPAARVRTSDETQALDPITPIPMRAQPAIEERAKDPESANYRKDSREWGNRAILLVLAGALIVAGMVLHHEVKLNTIDLKLSLVLKALKIEVDTP